jgi:hypothetical protein
MNYINEHWKGNFSLAKAYWASGLLANLLVMMPLWVIGTNIASSQLGIGFASFLTRYGTYGFINQGPLLFTAIYLFFNVNVRIWWAVGVWRSSTAYPKKLWRYLARICIVLIAVSLSFSVLAVSLIGSPHPHALGKNSERILKAAEEELSDSSDLEKALPDLVSQIDKALPEKLDRLDRLDKIKQPAADKIALSVTKLISFADYSKSCADTCSPTMRRAAIARACYDPLIAKLLTQDVDVEFIVTSQDGVLLADNTVTEDDCTLAR